MFEGVRLTSGQASLVPKLQAFLDDDEARIFILRGYAGTGKTFLMKGVVDYLSAVNRSVHLMAPTGRAAKVLSTRTSRSASTIHAHLYSPRDRDDPDDEDFTLVSDLTSNTDELDAVYVVDEASMVSDRETQNPLLQFGSAPPSRRPPALSRGRPLRAPQAHPVRGRRRAAPARRHDRLARALSRAPRGGIRPEALGAHAHRHRPPEAGLGNSRARDCAPNGTQKQDVRSSKASCGRSRRRADRCAQHGAPLLGGHGTAHHTRRRHDRADERARPAAQPRLQAAAVSGRRGARRGRQAHGNPQHAHARRIHLQRRLLPGAPHGSAHQAQRLLPREDWPRREGQAPREPRP